MKDVWDTIRTPFKRKIIVQCRICGHGESECPVCGKEYTEKNTEILR